MKILSIIIVFLFLFVPTPFAQSPDNSPYNPKNSQYNPDNSPYNPKNSPYNPDNSRYKPNNDRIIRDNQGNAKGYAVPKKGGGSNYYDFNGNRTGYSNE